MDTSAGDSERGMTPRMQAIMRRAGEVAREAGMSNVGTEHVALAILEDEKAILTQVLNHHGTAVQVREQLESLMVSPEYRGANRLGPNA